MLKHLSTLLIILLTTISSYAFSTTQDSTKTYGVIDSKPINIGEQITFKSEVLGTDEVINIYLPNDFAQSSSAMTYPVIFINDGHGEQFFHALTGIVNHLSSVDRMPKSIVVSLNSGGHIPEIFTNGMWTARDKIGPYGNPNKYLKHLESELFPYLEENYRANKHRTIIGVSGSSLFPLYSFTHATNMFNAHLFLASSDMIGMGYKKGETIIDAMSNALKNTTSKNKFLYVADADDDIVDNERYIKSLASLNTKLLPFKGNNFNFKIETIKNERHYDAFLKAMLSAFELMYPEKEWAPKYRELIKLPGDAMDNIDARYKKLSQDVGFEVLPNANRWNSVNSLSFIASKLLKDGRYKEAVRVAKRWHLYLPQSLDALFNLTKALNKAGEHTQAVAQHQRLVAQAEKENHPRLSEFKQALKNTE